MSRCSVTYVSDEDCEHVDILRVTPQSSLCGSLSLNLTSDTMLPSGTKNAPSPPVLIDIDLAPPVVYLTEDEGEDEMNHSKQKKYTLSGSQLRSSEEGINIRKQEQSNTKNKKFRRLVDRSQPVRFEEIYFFFVISCLFVEMNNGCSSFDYVSSLAQFLFRMVHAVCIICISAGL